jgi:hypothetical protein
MKDCYTAAAPNANGLTRQALHRLRQTSEQPATALDRDHSTLSPPTRCRGSPLADRHRQTRAPVAALFVQSPPQQRAPRGAAQTSWLCWDSEPLALVAVDQQSAEPKELRRGVWQRQSAPEGERIDCEVAHHDELAEHGSAVSSSPTAQQQVLALRSITTGHVRHAWGSPHNAQKLCSFPLVPSPSTGQTR